MTMIAAGMEAKVHFTINHIMLSKGILMSVTTTCASPLDTTPRGEGRAPPASGAPHSTQKLAVGAFG